MKVDEFLSEVREAMHARRVYADPIEHDGVHRHPGGRGRRMAVGGGDDSDNGGGGFGLRARPVGAYVIKDGEVSWKPAIDVVRLMLGWQVVAGIAAVGLWSFARRR
jgi:hypothetical protein